MKQKDIIFLAVSYFLLVVIWLVFSIYHNAVTSNIPQALSIQASPINPTFDEKTIMELKKRENIPPIFEATGEVKVSSPSGSL